MLNNHLTSFRSICRKLFISSLCIIAGCSNITPINSSHTNGVAAEAACSFTAKNIDQRHLIIAAKIKSSVMANCFRNYLRFEENKKQKISVCNQLSVRKSGGVSYVQVTDAAGKRLPKDLKMCVTQEYWKMDFKGLQLNQSHIIRFQLNFSSI